MKLLKLFFALWWGLAIAAQAADPPAGEEPEHKPISVRASASDTAVAARITTILQASEWFDDVKVTNKSGIITLQGATDSKDHKDWAENIAYRTENVVAVVNKLEILEQDPWSLSPVAEQTHSLVERFLQQVPSLVISACILLLAVFLARKLAAATRRLFAQRIESTMLRNLVAKLVAIPVLVIGVYLVFNVTGLGSLATTLIGGTGLLGLIIGIAFRDITENFLASILLSIQRPFVLGDMIQVLEYKGMVEAMTTRGTVLITLDGNHVQIPNTIIYKEPITNLTANPNIRQSFTVGIGYDASISEVQNLILTLLAEHGAVLDDPEPLILAEQLAASTVNLGIYFWVDSSKHSALKVRSSVMRKVKSVLMESGVSMPDDAREIIFPQGIDVNVNREHETNPRPATGQPVSSEAQAEDKSLATEAEGALTSDEGVLKQQARNGVLGDNKTNLLQQ